MRITFFIALRPAQPVLGKSATPGLDTDLTFNCPRQDLDELRRQGQFPPTARVFTGPVEDSVNGMIRFTYPGIFQGQEVEDIFLRFKDGRVEEAPRRKGRGPALQTAANRRRGQLRRRDRHRDERADPPLPPTTCFSTKRWAARSTSPSAWVSPAPAARNVSSLHWDMLEDMHKAARSTPTGRWFTERRVPLTCPRRTAQAHAAMAIGKHITIPSSN